MTAPPRIDRILTLLSDATVELDELRNEVPAYAVDATRFAKAEVLVLARRLENMKQVVGAERRPA